MDLEAVQLQPLGECDLAQPPAILNLQVPDIGMGLERQPSLHTALPIHIALSYPRSIVYAVRRYER